MDATNLGTLLIRFAADISQYESMSRKMDVLVADSLLNIGRAAAQAAKMVASVIADSVGKYADFESAMTKSMAIMDDVSAKTRSQMERTARSMATTGLASAEDLAKGYYYLASAGLDAEQSMKALTVVQQFAQAGDMTLEAATEKLTDSVASLGLASKDAAVYMTNMSRVSDVLAKAGALTNASTEQFATSLRTKSAASMRQFNVELEEGVAVLGVFANQGIKAEASGEAFAIVMRDFQTAFLANREAWDNFGMSVYDAEGKLYGPIKLIAQLESKFANLTDEQKKASLGMLGFNDRSVSATYSLLGMSKEMERFRDALRDASGFAGTTAAKQLQSLQAQWVLMKHNVDEARIALGEQMAPEMRAIVESAKEATAANGAFRKELLTVGDTLKTVVSYIVQFGVSFYYTVKTIGNLVLIIGGVIYTLAEIVTLVIGVIVNGVIQMTNTVLKWFTRMWYTVKLMFWEGADFVAQVMIEMYNELVGYVNDAIDVLNEMGADIKPIEVTASTSVFDKELEHARKQLEDFNKNPDFFGQDFDKEIDADIDKFARGDSKGVQFMKAAAEGIASDWEKAGDMLLSFDRNLRNANDAAAAAKVETAAVAESAKQAATALSEFERAREAARGFAAVETPLIIAAKNLQRTAFEANIQQLHDLDKAMSESFQRQDTLLGMLADGLLTWEEFNDAIERTTLSFEEYEFALNKIGRYQDPYAKQLESVRDLRAQLKAGVIDVQTFNRAAGEALADENQFMDKDLFNAQSAGASMFGNGRSQYELGMPTGVEEQDQMNALLAQEVALKDSYDRQLAIIQQYHAQKVITDEEYARLEANMRANYARQAENFEKQKTHMILGSAESISDSLASIAADTAGKQSGFYKTMFAMSKAFAIADASVKIAQGIAAAAANPWPTNLAAMASVAAATASIVSNIMAVRMTSFEGGGMTPGGARAGGMDGKGGFLAMLHPNERVIDLESPKSRGDAMGGANVTVNVINNAGVSVETETSDDGKNITLLIERVRKQVASDIATGRGEIPRALQQTFALGRGRG